MGRGQVAALGVAVALAFAALATWVVGRNDRSPVCAALAADVEGLGAIRHENGTAGFGPAWMVALTDGVEVADAPSRRAIAAAFAGDQEGYDRLRSALPGELRPAADRLHRLALDPDAAAAAGDAPDVVRDVRAIRRFGGRECNLV